MIREAIDKILSFRDVEKIEFGGRPYVNESIYAVKDPSPDTIEVKTLTGFVDYLEDCVDGNLPDNMIHIVDPSSVRLISPLFGRFDQRNSLIAAKIMINEGFPFGRFHELEDFIIKIQSHFVRTETVEQILAFITSVDSDATVNQTDDGITQRTTVKQGVALRSEGRVPNPVSLQPYRTFLEVVQPESKYVFRIKNEGGVKCALFEAGGGEWRLEAVKRIHAWFEVQKDTKRLPADMKILA